MRHLLTFLMTAILALAAPVFAVAQAPGSILVRGTVTDEDGLPVPMAAVQIKGTTTGTVSDDKGAWSIRVILDYKAQKVSTKKLPASHFIIRAVIYMLMILFVAIWRASIAAEAPIRFTVFSGYVMTASLKTIFQSFPVLLFYSLSFYSNQKKS